MFEEFGRVIPRKKREDLKYRWKLSNLRIFLADTDTSMSEFAGEKKNKRLNIIIKIRKNDNLIQCFQNSGQDLLVSCNPILVSRKMLSRVPHIITVDGNYYHD